MTPWGKSSRAGASSGQQECCGIPARPSFALPRLHTLLYSPQPRQICQMVKVPAYGTLPPAPARIPVCGHFLLSHCPRKFRHLPLYSPKQRSGENGSGRSREGGRRRPYQSGRSGTSHGPDGKKSDRSYKCPERAGGFGRPPTTAHQARTAMALDMIAIARGMNRHRSRHEPPSLEA